MASPLNTSLHKCTVLLSGGMDSAACVNFYKEQRFHVSAIHFSYGQAAESNELRAARSIADYYALEFSNLHLVGTRHKGTGEILGRNAMFVLAALMESGRESPLLAMGIHCGTSYFDCSPTFIEELQKLVDGYCDGTVRIATPFLEWSKPEIWRYCAEKDVPIHLTYSCEAGATPPCRVCQSCLDREALHVG